uniref:Uncharacterized protein n=1 Tax=Elaeophora elaphi TaxID=1147741 RepID=A0A0R3RYI4_9BILA
MHRERLNFESRSISFQPSQQTESFKRNSVRALKNTHRRPGGLEMILASVDDSLVLLSDLIATPAADNANLRNAKERRKFSAADFADSDQSCMIRKSGKKNGNFASTIKKSSQSKSSETAKIDLTGEEIIQWMGGLPIINSNKMLAYFCGGGNHRETKKFLSNNHEPYKIFSLRSKKRQFNDQITSGNLIREVC